MKLIVVHCTDYLYSKAGKKFWPHQIYSFEAKVARNLLFFHTAKKGVPQKCICIELTTPMLDVIVFLACLCSNLKIYINWHDKQILYKSWKIF